MKRTRSGAKAQQRSDNEDREKLYRQWHRTLDPDLYVTDVDQVEWGQGEDGSHWPVATFELSYVKSKDVPQKYLDAIEQRLVHRDGQGTYAVKLASMIGCHCWFVLYNVDVTKFWIRNLSRMKEKDYQGKWFVLDRKQYIQFLRDLRDPSTSLGIQKKLKFSKTDIDRMLK